jgi:hypothetical protein
MMGGSVGRAPTAAGSFLGAVPADVSTRPGVRKALKELLAA